MVAQNRREQIVMDKFLEQISKYETFLITTHINPDGDAICSELAICELLKGLGKTAIIVNNDPVPSQYKFIDEIDNITDIENVGSFDCAVLVDCPVIERIGKVQSVIVDKPLFNIDHHISNVGFADFALICKDAASTTEIIYELFKKANIEITKKIAEYIYIGIHTDTGSFNYSNTTKKTHEIISELLQLGVEPYKVFSGLHDCKKESDLKLLCMVLSTLDVDNNGKIASIYCTREMIESSGSDIAATENFVNYSRSINGVKLAFFIRQHITDENICKVSLRSKEDASANKVAAAFGGGGHEHAAGCTLEGDIESVKNQIIQKAKEQF